MMSTFHSIQRFFLWNRGEHRQSNSWKHLSYRGIFGGTVSIMSVLCIILCVIQSEASGKEYSIGIHEEAKLVPAKILESPAPQIPSTQQETAFKSSCEARFVIDPKGSTTVTIVSSSGSEEIDELALHTLKKWKFKPASLEDKPVSSTRRIKIEFEVE